jgi:transcriptional regulator with XRE-family HTH domain
MVGKEYGKMNIIKEKREEQRISQNELGKRVGLSQQQINRIENDGNIPLKHIPAFARVLNIPLTDLLPDSFKLIKFSPAPSSDCITVDVLDARACCGDGVENFKENVIGLWQMPKTEFQTITFANPEAVKMLRVFGDSMEPTLKDGDWVLVDTSRNAVDSDGMFLIRMTSGLAVKRIQNTIGSDIVIKSDNSKYDNITASASDVYVVGKVIYTLTAEKVG